mmetsp:Transcript_19289/g.18436  ORF Transcript_19289/g.18436 Transcript_19289/m.18436 type:complete len:82 (+) Transcript_19289:1054-1299(+)
MGEAVTCSLSAPTLTIIDIPLKIQELPQSARVKSFSLNEPLTLEYEVLNQSEDVFECTITIDENEDFYIGGELKSFVGIMP